MATTPTPTPTTTTPTTTPTTPTTTPTTPTPTPTTTTPTPTITTLVTNYINTGITAINGEIQRFWLDFQRRDLIHVKFLSALMMTSSLSLYPFLTLHTLSLDNPMLQTSLILTLVTMAAAILTPIITAVADRFGHLKLIFILMCLCSSGAMFLLSFMTSVKTLAAYSSPVSWHHSCSQHELAVEFDAFGEHCNMMQSDVLNVSFTIDNCFEECLNESFEIYPCFDRRGEACLHHDANNAKQLSMTFVGLSHDSDISANLSKTLVYNYTFVDINGELHDSLSCGYEIVNNDTSCSGLCSGTLSGDQLCQSTEQDDQNLLAGFTLIRVLDNILSTSIFVLVESMTLATIRDEADHGHQKIWGTITAAAICPLTGWLIDIMSDGKAKTDFSIAFYIYCVLRIFMAVSAYFLPINFVRPDKTFWKHYLLMLRHPTFLVFFCVMLISGAMYGFIEAFLFVFFGELGGDRKFMGVTLAVGGIATFPMTIFSGLLIRSWGHVRIISIGLICYSIRFFGYSLMASQWSCLAFETLEAFTSLLQLVTAFSYARLIASNDLLASANGLVTFAHYGIGAALGGLAGGSMLKELGTDNSFYIMGGISLFLGFLYCAVYKCRFIKTDNQLRMAKKSASATGSKEDIDKNRDAIELKDLLEAGPSGTVRAEVQETDVDAPEQEQSEQLNKQQDGSSPVTKEKSTKKKVRKAGASKQKQSDLNKPLDGASTEAVGKSTKEKTTKAGALKQKQSDLNKPLDGASTEAVGKSSKEKTTKAGASKQKRSDLNKPLDGASPEAAGTSTEEICEAGPSNTTESKTIKLSEEKVAGGVCRI